MNWSRVIKYCIILFIGTAAAAFPFGFLRGFLGHRGNIDYYWITIGQGLAVPLAAIIIFARLVYIQRTEPFYHALLVGLACWLISFPINVLFLHQGARNWAAGIIVLLVTAFIGTGIGNFIYSRSENRNKTA